MVEQLQGYSALQARLHAVGGAKFGQTLMNKLATQTVREATLLAPKKTRNLIHTIHVTSVTATTATVVASANYAVVVEYGSRPHIIRPRFKKALAFASQGITTARFGAGATLKFNLSGLLSAGSMKKYGNAAYVITKVVHHPGTRPHPFMLPGARMAVSKAGLADEIYTAWDSAA